MIRLLKASALSVILAGLYLWVRAFRKAKKNKVIFGTVPIMNYAYWARALETHTGRPCLSLVSGIYNINLKSDFDFVFDDLVPRWVPARLRREAGIFFATKFILENASALVTSYWGGPLGGTPLWRFEGQLLKATGIRTIAIPFGADIYMYSRIMDPCIRHVLLGSYPNAAHNEPSIVARVDYWNRHLDFTIAGWIVDGRSRWDALVPAGMVCVDLDGWKPRDHYSAANGVDAPVVVMHTSNHPDYTGTEFVKAAVEALRDEGLLIEFHCLSKAPNEQIKDLQRRADIRIDGMIFVGYGLAAIEGMASGLPVIQNLENQQYTTVFSRYSFYNECPLVSAAPESLVDVLRTLIRDPALREAIGRQSRRFVEKYHGYETASYFFDRVLRKTVDGEDIDVRNTFHPLLSDYNSRLPPIRPTRVEPRPPNAHETAAEPRVVSR